MVIVQDYCPASPAGPLPRPPWNGFRRQLSHKNTRGSLEYLHIKGEANTWKDVLKKWDQDTDFMALKTLKITPTLAPDAFEYMTTECHFALLAHLEISFNLYDERQLSPRYLSNAGSFLTSLPVLSSLGVCGWHSEFATSLILEHNGPRLTKLSLIQYSGQATSLPEVSQLVVNCPHLEELSIRIKRSRGDAQGVSIY
jgi:hypothetical protein